VQTAGVNVTDAEVQNLYRTRQADFTIPKRYKLRVIVVATEADAKAADELLKTKGFADVAREVSIDVSKPTGGEFGTMPESALQPAMKTALGNVRVGQTTGWIPSGDRQVKFLMEDVLPQQVRPLDAKLTREIRQREMLMRGSVRNNVPADMRALRARARIDIREKPFADAYKAFIETYLKSGN
jgi:parvulin-like peptidyl-prolyl isomerase